jgi:hypothetical protein
MQNPKFTLFRSRFPVEFALSHGRSFSLNGDRQRKPKGKRNWQK